MDMDDERHTKAGPAVGSAPIKSLVSENHSAALRFASQKTLSVPTLCTFTTSVPTKAI